MVSSNDGRNHWPRNWCVCLSGGGLRGGMALGHTDPEGETIEDRPIEVADLYATLSHGLGLDADRERVVNNRPITLIDGAGQLIREVLRS